MKALLLQDDSSPGPNFEESLRSRGHDVRCVTTTEEALAAFLGDPPDIVVLDVAEDREARLELCRRLRETDFGAWAVFLAITSSNESRDVEGVMGSGIDDYVAERDSPSVAAIRIALAEHRFEEKQSRRAILGRLHRAETRLQDMLETAPDAIVGCEADGTITLMNEQAVHLTGYERSELIGKALEVLLPEPIRTAHIGYRDRFFAHPATRPMGVAKNLKLLRKNGSIIDVDICLGYQEDGDRVYAVAAIRDITERRRMEEELRLAKQETEKAYERIRREIEAAARVQQALLPTNLPQTDQLLFAFQYHPCADLGGDALNAFWLDESHIGLYLLDVSGHGVAASLLSVALARLLAPGHGVSAIIPDRSTTSRLGTPAEVATSLNHWFLSHPTAEQYFTMIYGVLDTATLHFTYVSAGHPSMLLTRTSGEVEWLPSTGMPVGFDESAVFEEGLVRLQPGDRLLLYSDGVTEAANAAGEMFGDGRMRQVVSDYGHVPLEAMMSRLTNRVLDWSGGATSDDVSQLGLEVR
jgi:phosphoserine phosphatase RsbU/P